LGKKVKTVDSKKGPFCPLPGEKWQNTYTFGIGAKREMGSTSSKRTERRELRSVVQIYKKQNKKTWREEKDRQRTTRAQKTGR